jgi:hypothetical protein
MDSRGLLEVFHGCPSLEEAVLIDIIFYQDGPRITMRINLRDYPERPPEKWRKMENNTAQRSRSQSTVVASLRYYSGKNMAATIEISVPDTLLKALGSQPDDLPRKTLKPWWSRHFATAKLHTLRWASSSIWIAGEQMASLRAPRHFAPSRAKNSPQIYNASAVSQNR